MVLIAAWAVAATGPVQAQSDATYAVSFPDDWIVDHLDRDQPIQPDADGPELGVIVRERAYPADRSEECLVVDLGIVAATLLPLGVEDPMTLNRVAADILDLGTGGTSSSSLGYGETWSSSLVGTAKNGTSYAVYTYLGRDARPGVQDDWYVLGCSSDGDFHLDWSLVARTFEFEPPPDVLAATGPVVLGGRIELPEEGIALELPEGWVAADLEHPDLASSLQSSTDSARWFAEALEGPFGESLNDRAEAGDDVVALAWLPEDGPYWLESCEVSLQDSTWGSVDELVETGAAFSESDPELRDDHAWTSVELPAGQAARHDFWWSSTNGGTEYIFLDDGRQITLYCHHTRVSEADIGADRDRWLAIAEAFEFLPAEE